MRALCLAIVLSSVPALAQTNTWAIDRAAGASVMEEVSSLFFTVTNPATSRDPIWQFTLEIPFKPYEVEGGTGPSGWLPTTVDKKNKRITFSAIGGCGATGLRPGQSAVFEVRVTGQEDAADVTGDDVRGQGTSVIDLCGTRRKFSLAGGNSAWRRHALAGTVYVTPRALDVGGQVTVVLSVNNRSTATQSGLVPTPPVIGGAATFQLVSGPSPAQVNNLALDASGTYVWVYRATGRGVGRFTTTATNAGGTVTSPPVESLDVSVGRFPAVLNVDPAVVISGGLLSLQLQVSNNTGSTISGVVPAPPSTSASPGATATLVSGPSPASVASLAAGATAAFSYVFRVTGLPGDSLTFSAVASGTEGNGAPVTSDPVKSATVRISQLTLTTAPKSVLSGSGATDVTYTLTNGTADPISQVVLLRPDITLFLNYSATSVPAGWTAAITNKPRGMRFTAGSAAAQIAPGASQTFTLHFTAIGTVTTATPSQQRAQATFTDSTLARTDSTVTVVPNVPPPELAAPVAIATPGKVRLAWNNPLTHHGTLILRATGAPPDTAPTPGRAYALGELVGNATVVYVDAFSFAGSAADTTVSNGATYFYRLFNRNEYDLYSPGDIPAPAPSNVLRVVVPTTAASQPAWCATYGLPALQQPFTDIGRAVYQSNQASFFSGHLVNADPPTNGAELWRPSMTLGVVQARPTALAVEGQSQASLFVGDQLGYAYRLSTSTGAIAWVGNGGAPIGEVVQAQASVALRAYSGAAFQALYPTDLVFFATRNSAPRSSNSVRALRIDTGAVAWTYQPGDLDQVVAAPLFDGFTGTLWVGSLSSAGPSLRVLDVLNPATPLLTVSDLGDLPGGVVRSGPLGQALVADRNGVARGYALSTRALLWETNLGGAVSAPLVPYLTDFFASTATGVQRYHVDTTTNAVTPVWSAPAAMRLPSLVRVHAAAGKLFVGDADGYLRRLDLATGAQEAAVRLSTLGGVGAPSLDTTAGLERVHVGTADGRLCAIPPTF